MRKIYKELTKEQKERGVYFSSTLSKERTEQKEDTIHEVLRLNEKDFKDYREYYNAQQEQDTTIKRLKDDKFFNDSLWKFNIIRS